MFSVRNIGWIALITLTLLLAGCIGTPVTASKPEQPQEQTPATQPLEKANPSLTETNPYEVAGINDPEKFNEIFRKVQDLVAKDDKQELAKYILYPLLVNKEGKTEKIADPKAFIANYDRIFTMNVKSALQHQKIEKLFVNYQGVMVGAGEVWFGVTDNGDIGIRSVNLFTPSANK